MKTVEVRTEAEFTAAIVMPDTLVDLMEGIYSLVTKGLEAPWIRLRAGVKLSVVAQGSSQPHVEAWGSSQPHVVASAFVQLSLLGKVVAKCSAKVSVLIKGDDPKVEGGNQIKMPYATTNDWCEYHGLEVKNGAALVYKGLNKDGKSNRGLEYKVGETVQCDQWNDVECDAGLHFVPHPSMAAQFFNNPLDCVRFVACEIMLSDSMVFLTGAYPFKIKSKNCKVLFECDRYGKEIKAEMKTG